MENLARLGISLESLLTYAASFGLVVLIVYKYLTKPLLKMLDERRNTIKSNLAQAEKLKDQLGDQKKTMEEEKKAMQAHLQKELTDSRKTLSQKEKEADAAIDAKKAKMMEDVQAAIKAEKDGLIGNTQGDILTMVEKMVNYIVSEKVSKEVVKESVNDAWAKYSSQ